MINNKVLKIKQKFRSQDAICHTVLTTLSLFANKTRFRILCALCEGEFCVNELVEAVGLGKTSHVSQQLKMLTLAGLIGSRRDKKAVIYRLADKRISAIVRFLEATYVSKEALIK